MAEVTLHVYDIINTENDNLNTFVKMLNNVGREVNAGGVFHGAIEVFGFEWSFGFCPNGSGVYKVKPKQNPMYTFRESIPLGTTSMTPRQVAAILRHLQQTWAGAEYDLLQRNCCHFCDALCEELGVEGIPGWVNRFAYGADVTFTATSRALQWVRSVYDASAAWCDNCVGYFDTLQHPGSLHAAALDDSERWPVFTHSQFAVPSQAKADVSTS